MTWLSSFIRPSGIRAASANWSGAADGWYETSTAQSDAGVWVSPEVAMRCGTVYSAVRFLADSIAMCPLLVYKRLDNKGKQRDPDHYAYQTLHRRPNAYQTSYRWRHTFMTHLALWGNAYNRIVAGPRSFVTELRPLHPSRVRVFDQLADGRLVYEYRPPQPGAPAEKISQDEMLHFRSLSMDGMSGLRMYDLIRNAVGVALAAEKHAATFLKKGTRLSGVLSTDMPWNEQVQQRISDSWTTAFGGSDNVGKVAVVGDGFNFTPMGVDNKGNQFIELRDFQVGEILRFLGVPGVVVGFADKTATYASAEAFFEKGGIKHCVLPWLTGIEHEIDFALLLDEDTHFVEFNLDVLLRANTRDRYNANLIACGGPWMTRNEIRILENMDPADESLDDFIQPANAATSPTTEERTGQSSNVDGPSGGDGTPKDGGGSDEEDATARRTAEPIFARDAATRVVRREVAAIKGGNGKLGAAVRFAKDNSGWNVWITNFYQEHAAYVASAMHIDPAAAQSYCDQQAATLRSAGLLAVESWETTRPDALVEMALAAYERTAA